MVSQTRVVHLAGAMNFRDLGGYQTTTGQTVRWGKFYRADSLSQLTDHDLAKLKQRHVTVDCDLRTAFEQRSMPDQLTPEMRFVDCHVYAEDGDDDTQVSVPGKLLKTDFLGSVYQHVILNAHSQQAFGKVMKEALQLGKDEALVFHCSAGKDRTGMMAALILKTLGVDDETIIKDYLLTNELYSFTSSSQLLSDDEMGQLVDKMNITKGDGPVMTGFLKTIEMGWETIDQFLIQQLKMTPVEIQQFRTKFLA